MTVGTQFMLCSACGVFSLCFPLLLFVLSGIVDELKAMNAKIPIAKKPESV